MPPLSVWAIRLAFAYLIVGAFSGGSMLAARAGALPLVSFRLLPAHVDIMMIGWLVQLAVGVGYWILPRVEGSRPRSGLAVAAVLLLNVGVPIAAVGGSAAVGTLLVVGRVAELLAALAFGVHAFTRVRYGGLVGRVHVAPDTR